MEREVILAVDPKRCRPWKFHNRTDAWYTRERCQDLIDSIVEGRAARAGAGAAARRATRITTSS